MPSSEPLMTSTDTSVYIYKDVVWQQLEEFVFFQGQLHGQRPPSLTSGTNPVIVSISRSEMWQKLLSLEKKKKLQGLLLLGIQGVKR